MAKRSSGNLLAANVHDNLRRKILTLEIKPGSRLVEDEISADLGVGRTPVREALLRLQGEGFVTRGKGWVVDEIDPDEVPEIFESRMAIEGFATRLAAERRTQTELAELKRLNAEMTDFSGLSRVELNRLNREFHQRIVGASKNTFFIEMHERTQYNYWNLRLPVLFTKDQVVESNRQHQTILDAIEASDANAAEDFARVHIRTTLVIVQDALSGF